MADLHWERQMAGLYQTMFYANGYKYRIEKDESYNLWRAYYMWDKSSDKKWKRLRTSWSCETLKEAKKYCQNHNERPRAKWKLIGKVPDGKFAGQYAYQELDRRGEPYKYRTQYIDPLSYMTFIDDDLVEKEVSA